MHRVLHICGITSGIDFTFITLYAYFAFLNVKLFSNTSLSLLLKRQEAFVDSVDQDQTARERAV